MSERVLPLHFSQSLILKTSCERAFEFLDDFQQLGAHMMSSSWMMAGSHMRYEFDSMLGHGVGARVWLKGSILGIPLRIDEQVVESDVPIFKSWVTLGAPRLLVMQEYRMGFSLEPCPQGTRLEVFIDYALPENAPARWLGRLLAGTYARWCVRSMLEGANRHFNEPVQRPAGTGANFRSGRTALDTANHRRATP